MMKLIFWIRLPRTGRLTSGKDLLLSTTKMINIFRVDTISLESFLKVLTVANF